MKTIKILYIIIGTLCLGVWLSCNGNADKAKQRQYEPNWESLSQWTVPSWFDDAVLGIYCHWGVYSVPGYKFNVGAEQVDSGLWYGRFMYVPNEAEEQNYGCWDHHWKTYGDPAKFG